MTFPEVGEKDMEAKNKNCVPIGQAVQKTIIQASEQGRLTCGIYESTQTLQRNPTNVMLCLLPETQDVSLHIYHKLIEAFCWENEVRLLKIDSVDKVAKIMGTIGTKSVNDNEMRSLAPDYNCILVGYPFEESSFEEECVAEYYKELMYSDTFPLPVVEIPA